MNTFLGMRFDRSLSPFSLLRIYSQWEGGTVMALLRSVRWRLLCALFAGAWLVGLAAPANAVTYAYRNDVFAYDTPSGAATTVTWHAGTDGNWLGSPACTSYPNGDDDWADVVFPSGFTFIFGGTTYSQARIYSNGMLVFGTDVSGFHRDYTPQALPIAAAGTPGITAGTPVCTYSAIPANVMIAYWVDIVAGTARSVTGASVKYELLGAAPSRRFVVSWNTVALYSGTSTVYSFQIQLLESTAGLNGNFRYQYTVGSTTGNPGTVGVQLTTADYTQYSFNQAFIDPVAGTAILWYPANQLAAKGAEYHFDESAWSGAAGEIKDTSGGGLNATRLGATTNVAGGKICRGANIPANTSNIVMDAVATPITPANVGSVDFWYKSAVAWNAALSDAMLFDATAVAAKPFYLEKTTAGKLKFVVTDSAGTVFTVTETTAQTFAALTWVHVGVSWNMRPGTNQTLFQIFLNGVVVPSATVAAPAPTITPTAPRTTSSGTMAALSTLDLGDNATSGVTPAGGTPNSANGILDEVNIYATEINASQATADMNTTRPSCTVLDHFHIIHNGAVSSCTSPANITIEAHDATHALFSLSGTSMNLSTNLAHGTWSNVTGGAINLLTVVGAGTGTATYTFSAESSVTFGLSDTQAESLNVNVLSGAITEHSGAAASCVAADYTTGSACDVSRTFFCNPASFNCIESSLPGTSVSNGHLYTKLAGTGFSFDVVALKADGTQETSFASLANKAVTVELVVGSGVTACLSRATLSTPISQTLTFLQANQATEQGRKTSASMTVGTAYPDLSCRVTDATQSPSVVACSSDDFSVRPTGFTVTTPVMTNTALTGTPKAVAGTAFTLSANSGVTAGYTTTPALVVSNVNDHAGAVIAATALTGTFSAGDGATASGAAFKYLDVGNIQFAADAVTDSSFTSVDQTTDCVSGSTSNALSSGKYGCNIGSAATLKMGRWYPSHYSFTGALTPACAGGFTYMDNDALGVALTLKAHASTGAAASASDPVASRYTSGYTNLASVTLSGDNGGAAVAVTRLASPVFPTMPTTALWSAGLFPINGTYAFSKLAAPDGPYDLFKLKAAVSDPDSSVLIGLAAAQETNTTSIRFGRLRVQNAYGSELLALPLPMIAQYWNGNGWAQNALDSCTLVTAPITGAGLTFHPLPSGTSLLSTKTTASVSATGKLVAGDGQLSFTAPGSGNGGYVDIVTSLATQPWLRYPWTGAGNVDPTARATFGIYKSPQIYRRENY